MIINIKIKDIREKKGMSLRKLEILTGISRNRLADIENKKIPTDKILFVEMVVIAENLACSILDLYELTYLELKGIEKI